MTKKQLEKLIQKRANLKANDVQGNLELSAQIRKLRAELNPPAPPAAPRPTPPADDPQPDPPAFVNPFTGAQGHPSPPSGAKSSSGMVSIPTGLDS